MGLQRRMTLLQIIGRLHLKDTVLSHILHEKIGEKGIISIIKNFNLLGYDVEEISTEIVKGNPIIIVRETGFINSIQQQLMSQGMLRSLAILIFIEHTALLDRLSWFCTS